MFSIALTLFDKRPTVRISQRHHQQLRARPLTYILRGAS